MKTLLVVVLTVGCYSMPGMQGPARNPEHGPVAAAPMGASEPRPEPADEPVGPKPVAGPGDYEGPPGDPKVAADEPEVEPTEDIETLWSSAASAADSLAIKRWQIRLAKENFKGPKNDAAVKKMEQHHAAIVAEEFCPAALAFRAQAGTREYNKRAAKHCTTSAPVATGLSGKQVTLTVECATAFATSCVAK